MEQEEKKEHVEVVVTKINKITNEKKEYKNQISLENSSVPKWVLGQYWNKLFSNMVAIGGLTPSESVKTRITTYIDMFVCYTI